MNTDINLCLYLYTCKYENICVKGMDNGNHRDINMHKYLYVDENICTYIHNA
jgi:hypothetical protein